MRRDTHSLGYFFFLALEALRFDLGRAFTFRAFAFFALLVRRAFFAIFFADFLAARW